MEEHIQMLKELNENMQKLRNIENEINMLELALYQKNMEEIKEKKITEITKFFERQSKFYNQKTEKYKKDIENNIEKYNIQIEKLILIYDKIYMESLRLKQNAIDNGKIAIANIVTLEEKIKSNNITEQEENVIKKTIIACAQKKLNYEVIVDECDARIKWCIENSLSDIEEVFKNNMNKMQIYNENIVNKIRRIIFNKFMGKNKYIKFLKSYETEYLEDIKNKNDLKILDLAYVLKAIEKQMKIANKQIANEYTKMIYN